MWTNFATNGADFISSLDNRWKESLEKSWFIKKITNLFGPNIRLKWRSISITDVTLREWDQAPLSSFNVMEKKLVYLLLRELQVDVIEVWFPAWDTDYANIQNLIDFFSDDPCPPVISVLWRCADLIGWPDTGNSLSVTQSLKKSRIHCFIATSNAHIWDKFCNKKNKQTWETENLRSLEEWKDFVKKSIRKTVWILKNEQEKRKKEWKILQIEWSPEDATNTDYPFLLESIRIAIESGAEIINLPDTVWVSKPEEYKSLFFLLSEDTIDLKKQWYKFSFSSHIHNDKWYAKAWAIGAVEWWAEHIESTLLWIWERAGNTKTHDILQAFGVDNECEIIFKKNKKLYLTSIFSEAVRKILWDDSWVREPGIWSNAQTDSSWVHTANPELYGESKDYAKLLWVNVKEKFFSARWWANGLLNLADSIWLDLRSTEKKDLKTFIAHLSKIAEVNRMVFPTHILREYLLLGKRLSPIRYNINSQKGNISVDFILDWVKYKINEDYQWENGFIEALMRWIRKIANRNIQWKEYFTKDKPSLSTIITYIRESIGKICKWKSSEYFNTKIEEIHSSIPLDSHEDSIWLTYMQVLIDGEERNIVYADTDTQRSIVEAIVSFSFPYIINLKNSKKNTLQNKRNT